ncbi:YeeE/YedE thiosulfate transporter family protein [Alkaliphilus transvaalensis]|uniref:YeeE/YedE thiosulfate transporter family protein n=1 Tax=Alkaliphilus transvaalensis TaxID=114628 RepID=UPI0006880D37|nr:YeeE/YedE thiosulfate transporter family protein [Alkaliphilus transvaalensis]
MTATSSKIEALKRQREMEVKKKKNQSPFGIIITGMVITIYLALINYNLDFSSYWIIGILMGITLQRSRFCFAASFRDPIMVGSTSLLKAVLLAFIVSTIGFFIIQLRASVANPDYLITELPGQFNPVGLHTALGAILFGTGMVVAGGCASGVLIRIGEGHAMQLVVLIGFIIGATLGAAHFPFWDGVLISKTPVVHFPNHIGFFPSLILQLLLLCGLYFIADWYDKKNNIMTT